ncbi:hypothetical protein D3C79_856400 [compost metagenome]
MAIVLEHAVGVFIADHPALAFHRFTHMGEGMHACGVHPDKERFVGLDLLVDEIDRRLGGFIVDGLHAFAGQGTGVLDLAVRTGLDHPTW